MTTAVVEPDTEVWTNQELENDFKSRTTHTPSPYLLIPCMHVQVCYIKDLWLVTVALFCFTSLTYRNKNQVICSEREMYAFCLWAWIRPLCSIYTITLRKRECMHRMETILKFSCTEFVSLLLIKVARSKIILKSLKEENDYQTSILLPYIINDYIV